MARVKITEYAAKRILFGKTYRGVSIVNSLPKPLPKGRYVVKVDQGIKKRFKLGLLAVDVPASHVRHHIERFKKKGFNRFLIEPFVVHESSKEHYFSLERIRTGIRVLYSPKGGIEIEESADSVIRIDCSNAKDTALVFEKTGIPKQFLDSVFERFDSFHFSFLEINPLVIDNGNVYPLDAAVLVDSAAEQLVSGVWAEADYTERKKRHPREKIVAELAKTTPASLKLSVLNPDGSLFFLLSGGGGSITIGDQAVFEKGGSLIANYGEYSGGPTTEETYLYAREIVALALASRAKKKALVIAGGIANFTDIRSTFTGIINALEERYAELKRAKLKVFVRRGGPHENEGLTLMKAFLEKRGVAGSISGSDAPITKAVRDAVRYLKS
jgi:ATP citrate (pro-S)-lyase